MGWKIYFWIFTPLMAAVTGLSIVESMGFYLFGEEDPFLDESWTWLDWMSLLITWVGITGFFGFIYKKVIGEQKFWKRWFAFTLIFDISYEAYEIYPEGIVAGEIWLTVLVYSLAIPLAIPFYVAIYLYGYKSNSLWNPQPNHPQ